MKVTANIATRPGREIGLRKCIASLHGQVDTIRIYFNDFKPYDWIKDHPKVTAIRGKDVGSAAKFHWLNRRRNEYYFTCDDDLIYPHDYVEKTIREVDRCGGYVSYHGRKLRGIGLSYYKGHQTFHYARRQDHSLQIDVPGTGVGCVRSRDFSPSRITRKQWRNMDDVGIAYECARQGVSVTLLKHSDQWITDAIPMDATAIFRQESRDDSRQSKLADQIVRLRNRSPKVSVIIPYNRDRGWLQDAIDSVHNQIYDGEIELILSKSNANKSTNLNKGIELATGDYIKYLDEDDMLTPGSVQHSVKAIEGVDFIHGNAIVLVEPAKELRPFQSTVPIPTAKDLTALNSIYSPTTMYRRELFDKYGGFDESLDTCEEYEFNLRLLSCGCRIGFSTEKLAIYRKHNGNKSTGVGVDQNYRAEVKRKVIALYA